MRHIEIKRYEFHHSNPVPRLRKRGAILPFHHTSQWPYDWLSTGTTLRVWVTSLHSRTVSSWGAQFQSSI